MTVRIVSAALTVFLAGAAVACSGPKGSSAHTVGPRTGESTAPLPSDPTTPNPDAGDVPNVSGESTTPGEPSSPPRP